MWLFAKKGFFSIVEDRDDKNRLLVRARVKGDIEKYFPEAEVIEGGGSDYLYRAFIPRGDVAVTVFNMVANINYDNYKANMADSRRRSRFYFLVWFAMQRMQDALRR